MEDQELRVLSIIWTLLRVALVVAVWGLLFLAVFLGYLTIPVVMLAAFTVALLTPGAVRQARRLMHTIRDRKRRT